MQIGDLTLASVFSSIAALATGVLIAYPAHTRAPVIPSVVTSFVGPPLAAVAGLNGTSGNPVGGVVRLFRFEAVFGVLVMSVTTRADQCFCWQFVLSCSYCSRP